MTSQERREYVIREFRRRRTRQLVAVAATIFLLVALLWRHAHPGLLFGEIPRDAVAVGEIVIIAGFILFSAVNWRCPACGKYLCRDISPERCRKCGTPLQ